jgi:hypothetical protein
LISAKRIGHLPIAAMRQLAGKRSPQSWPRLALDTIDLVILRWQVDEAMSNKPVDWQEYYQLTCARELLAERNTTVLLQ